MKPKGITMMKDVLRQGVEITGLQNDVLRINEEYNQMLRNMMQHLLEQRVFHNSPIEF